MMTERLRTVLAGVALLVTVAGAESCSTEPKPTCTAPMDGPIICDQGAPTVEPK